MDYLLIIVLGIVVLSIWNSNRDAHEQMREAMHRLEREIDFLRSQLAALVKANAKIAQAEGDVATSEAATSGPAAAQPEQPKAAQVVAHPAVPFTPPFEPKAAVPAPVSRPPASAPPLSSPTTQASSGKEPSPAGSSIFSLEETLGTNWLNKLGIAILVIGLAFFLAYKLQTWGPAGKILCGFAVSTALLGGGIWLERKPTYRLFARAGIGGGWALAYFTTFAMYHLQAARIVDSLPVDLALMLLVAAGMVLHSLRYRSQTVTSLAFLLAFVTLLTSHVEQPDQTVVFSLVASAILAIGLVVVTTINHWAVLELCGLIAVYVSHFVWLSNVLPEDRSLFAESWPSTLLILLYWLIFRVAYVMRTPFDEGEENLSSGSAILNSGGVLALLKYQLAHPEWAFWALAVLGVLELLLAYWAKPKRRQAFVVLSTIAVVLLVSSVPFRFHGVSWPVLWLVQAQMLAIAGLRLGEPVFRRLGLLTGLITGGVLALHDVMPLAMERLFAPDINRHWWLTVGLALAALLYWTHAEVYPRRWPEIKASAIEGVALTVTSWLGTGAAAAAMWVVLPERWVPAGWLVLVVALGFAADWIASIGMALQADVLALVAWFTLVAEWEARHGEWNYRIPMLAGTALFYCAMRRKTVARLRNHVPAAYSWAAAVLLVLLTFDIFPDPWIAPVLAALCIALFEIGRFARKGFLRWQGYALLAIAFTTYFVGDLPSVFSRLTGSGTVRSFTFTGSDLLEVLILMAAGYWLLERTRGTDRVTNAEHEVGLLADAVGTLCLAVWFGVLFPFYVQGGEGWVAAIWATMATALMAFAWITRRRTFVAQAIALALAAVVRGLLFDLINESSGDFWHGPLYHLSVAALVLIAALPFAFKLRGPEFWEDASLAPPEQISGALRHPEQWFFFVPFGMMVAALAA